MAGGAGSDGLLQRIQVFVWPDEFPAWKNVDRYPNSQAKQRVCDIFEKLDTFDPVSVVEQSGGDRAAWFAEFDAADDVIFSDATRDIPSIRFCEPAQLAFNQWRDGLEHRLRSEELTKIPALESHLAKYRSLMPSLALIFHLVDIADNGPKNEGVSESAALLAIEWCAYLELHAKKLYGSIRQASPGHRLATHIQNGAIRDGDPIRKIYLKGWQGLGTASLVRAAISELDLINWARLEQTKATELGGRPSEVIRLHPVLRRPGK